MDSDDPHGIIGQYLDAVVPGSNLAISHASLEGATPSRAEEATQQYRRSVTDITMRTRAEIIDLFAGVDLVEPGVVYLTEWHPDPDTDTSDATRMSTFAGVGRKVS